MLSVLTLLVSLLLGFSVGGSTSVEEQGRATVKRPSAPAPSLPGRNAPPPAWIETERGSFWLAITGFCWKKMCVDMSLVRRPRPIAVRRGEVVRFHLGFSPRRVSLVFGLRGGIRLEPGRVMSWRVDRGGSLALDASTTHGSVSYFAVFELR